MKTRTLSIIITAILCCMATSADAQGFLKRLKERALNAAENAVTNKVENKVHRETEEVMDAVLDGDGEESSSSKPSSKKKSKVVEEEEEVEAEPQEVEATYEQSDFVPGSIVFFEDNLQNEQMGEFASKWDLVDGSTDVAIIKGKKCIHFEPGSRIEPLMTNQSSYMPDMFTLEFDFWMNDPKTEMHNCYELEFINGNEEDVYQIRIGENYSKLEVTCRYKSTTGDWRESGDGKTWELKKNDWSHFAMSFNKRALKIYINGKRVINIPNCTSAVRMKIHQAGWGGFNGNKNYMTNFRYAKGALELYDQNVTDMSAVEKAIATTGKFVTNNILFETGKATLKPESMEEIQKVADYMKKNPSVRFEVQGHTDNQGSDAVNDPLSQQRAESVVKALVGLGCDDFNLRAVGKGSHEPVADNKSEAGRAKNRRVEFIKK
jgi:outer membrane protein OmpA-like peptidoglycan-associated protein